MPLLSQAPGARKRMGRGPVIAPAIAGFAVCALAAFLALGLASPARAAQAAVPSSIKFVKSGTTSFTPGAPFISEGQLQLRPSLEVDHAFQKAGSGTLNPARVPADHVPRAAGNAVTQAAAGVFSFDGLTGLEQAYASGYVVEPPDQALAVGNGYVLEGVNLAIAVYSDAGTQETVTGLNRFFNLPDYVFTSDPKALYDADTGRWFVSILAIYPSGLGYVMVAVSQSSDPTGNYNIYHADVTNSGVAGCPCYGDQPLIGLDANGIYINTNEFSLVGAGFIGTEIIAADKSALVAGAPGANGQGFLLQSDTYPIFYSLQPANVPPEGEFETAQGGTEYFLGSLDDFNVLTDQLAVFALTNTSSLSSTPNVQLQYVIVDSEVYGPAPASDQPLIPVAKYSTYLPLADALRNGALGVAYGGPFNEHEELTDSNDDRMAQTVFAGGKLFGALDTVVKTKKGPASAGIAWFAITPGFDGDTLTASVANQGYVSVAGQNVNYPSIGVNAAGKGIMSFTLVGPGFPPSPCYATIDADNGVGDVQILARGFGPDDGFSGYVPFGDRVGRWGDYSAAVADESGAIWLATEYIPDAPRFIYINWGTRISKVNP